MARREARRLAGAVVVATLVAGCRLVSHEPTIAPGGQATAHHAVTSARIKAAMAELDRLRPDRLPQELDVPALQRRRLDEIADAAGAMAQTADAIPEAVSELSLGDADRTTMVALALRLRAQAATLEERARRGDVRGVETLLTAVGTTCNQCHTAFRGLPATKW
jgi:cytochrome c556